MRTPVYPFGGVESVGGVWNDPYYVVLAELSGFWEPAGVTGVWNG